MASTLLLGFTATRFAKHVMRRGQFERDLGPAALRDCALGPAESQSYHE